MGSTTTIDRNAVTKPSDRAVDALSLGLRMLRGVTAA
jgi:hypothetical protein